MRILFCSSYTIRLCFKICGTKYVFPLCVGPTTNSESLWRKLNSGQDLVAKDAVRAAVLGLFAGGECSLCFIYTLLSRLLNVYIGHGYMRRPFDACCHDDTGAYLR